MQALKGKKKIFFFLFLFFLFTTFQFNQKNIFRFFKIKKVTILNSKNIEEHVKNNLREYLLNKNLLNINQKKISFIFSKSDWIKNYKIKKKYPDHILFELTEYKVIGLRKIEDKFFLVNDDFLISSKTLSKTDNLNFIEILGEFKKQNFKDLYIKLSKSSFFKDIYSINFLNLNRIELSLKNNIYIKLGNYNFENQFKLIEKIIKIKKEVKLLDLRNEGIVIIK